MGKFDGILLASDLDGTLICSGELSEENLAAIKYFIDNGGMFTTATGRNAAFIKRLQIPVNAPLITSNGALITDAETEEVLKSYPCHKSALKAAREMLLNENFLFGEIYTPGGNIRFSNAEKVDFDNFDMVVNKMVFVFDAAESALAAKEEFNKKYSSGLVFERSWPVGLELRSSEGGKGNCLREIKKLTNAKITIGVGDWENDESLLKAADISYAPKSGNRDIIAIAQRVTVACEEHVIAAIVKELDVKGVKN